MAGNLYSILGVLHQLTGDIPEHIARFRCQHGPSGLEGHASKHHLSGSLFEQDGAASLINGLTGRRVQALVAPVRNPVGVGVARTAARVYRITCRRPGALIDRVNHTVAVAIAWSAIRLAGPGFKQNGAAGLIDVLANRRARAAVA